VPASCIVSVLAPSATRCASRFQPGCTRYPRKVHAPVLFKVLILGRKEGVLQDRRNLFVGEQDAALQSEAADDLAVVGV